MNIEQGLTIFDFRSFNNTIKLTHQLIKTQAIIGNDIIDWQRAKHQHQKLRNRCLEKLFQLHEIEYIRSAENPLLAFWYLWSVKESAYKAWQRQTMSKPVFNAHTFSCHNIKANSVYVVKDNFYCEVETVFTSQYIYSQCQSKTRTFKILKSNQDYLRLKNKWFNEGWQIQKTAQGVPYLFNKQKSKYLAISLSHDNRLTAVNYQLNS